MVPPEPPGPTPIPVEGDIQIFEDAECTQYWTGTAKGTLYARVNVSWGFNGGWGDGSDILASGPDDKYPDDPYIIYYNIDWISNEDVDPFPPGTVVSLVNEDPYEVENPVCIFNKP